VNGIVALEIISDCQSVEIFGNSGSLYMPIVTTPYSQTDNSISLTSQGTSTLFNILTINQLGSIWPAAGD
jgi:sucrose-6-phosphate hydrolase SacC (GH32 family)